MDLRVDPGRRDLDDKTGIYIRAKDGEKWVSIDFACLDKPSLIEFLAGWNRNAVEDIIGILLGHGHLHLEEANGKDD